MSPDRRRARAESTARVGQGTAATRASSVQGRGGPLVLDRYALHKRLGSGAFGTVWMARDERLERDVAVKILSRDLIADGRFEREARAAARLSHPAIVTLYEAAVDDEGAYLVSELVRGETLGGLLEEGELSDRDILEIGVALCDALAHAHEQGVVHRDVKPSNVLIPNRTTRSTRTPCKLTDFGVARIIDSDSLTLTGDVIGTLNYMAPEQSAGLEAGEAADLYSLALVLYEALSGVNPLRGAAARGSRRLLQLPPLRRQRRDLPAPMAQAIDRALRPRIEERGGLADLRDGLAGGVGHVGEEPGIVTGAFERGPRDEHEEDGVARRFGIGTLIAPRDGGLTAPRTAGRGARRPWSEEDLDEADRSRLIWQARAVAGACAAGSAAWLDHALLQPHGALTAPVALVALVAGGLSLLLPRLGWIALALYICGATAVQGAAGITALVAIGALLPIVLLPASGTLWGVPALAPALGFVGLAGAWPALAGWAHRPWRRMMLGASGWLWLALAGPLAGRTLYEPRPHGTAPQVQWRGSITQAADHVLSPLAHSGQLAGAVVWAAAAILVPWVVRRRNPLLDLVRAVMWAAALAAATPMAITALARASHGPQPGSASTALAGALAAAALALAPLAVVRAHHAIRRGGRVP